MLLKPDQEKDIWNWIIGLAIISMLLIAVAKVMQ